MRSGRVVIFTSTRLRPEVKSKRRVASLCQKGAQNPKPRTRLIIKQFTPKAKSLCLEIFGRRNCEQPDHRAKE